MGFNYGYEQKLFEKEWVKKKIAMVNAGMKEDAIKEMYDFDWEWFKSIRRYRTSTEFFDPLLEDRIAEKEFEEVLDFIDQLEDERFIQAVKSLTLSEYKLLMKLVEEGMKQAEIARESGQSRNNISRKVIALTKKIKIILFSC